MEKSNKDKNTKEKILEVALKLFAQCGYIGTSMNDIAKQLGITKQALYKHYASKQEILDSIVRRMNKLDQERAVKYEMPEGNMQEVTEGYQTMDLDKIKRYAMAQFKHWTEEEFSSCFRKMLTLEQYRDPEMASLYQYYLTSGPLQNMEEIFLGLTGDEAQAKQFALNFYGPIFLLYSIYDGMVEKQSVFDRLNQHVEQFSEQLNPHMK